MKKKVYRVAIIGAGRIGAGFDEPHSRKILTHAHAFSANSRTEVVAFVDANHSTGRREAKRWSASFFTDIDRMFLDTKPDIVIIATPDNTHAVLLEKILHLHPSLIICEKPVVETPEEALHIKKVFRNSKIPTIVNYSRRFDTSFCEVRENIQKGVYGRVISGSCLYDKSLIHNGSHLVDLARFLFGEMNGYVCFPQGKTNGLNERVSAIASFDRCQQFHIMTGDERFYTVGEFDILTEKARLRFSNVTRDLLIQKVVDDKVFKGYRILGTPKKRKTGLFGTLPELARHSVAVLDCRELPRSTVTDALKSYAACLTLAKGFKKR